MDQYLIRIISLDSYMSAPIPGLDVMYSDFRGSSINLVPVLRLFGSIATGEKICAHIHGVFPYLYIPYDGIQEANSLMYQIAASIDKAVNISLNQTSSNTQHVYKISLVSGIPMYGYHSKSHQFFKIYLYNPLLIRKVSSLVLNDSTLGKLYQPHESHLNFTLQFMIDYNLHGMSNMVISEMKFRIDHNSVPTNIDPDLYLPVDMNKISICELEGDVLAEHIINRQEIASGNIAVNPGLTALWSDEMQRRRNKGETSQIGSFLELKHINLPPTKTHSVFKQALMEKLSVWSSNNVNNKLSDSVYPAETPDGMNIQNASLVDSNTPSSSDLTFNDSILTPDNFNDTLIATQQSDCNMSMDADALHLLEILKELRESAKENDENDSVLTQVVNEDDDEKELDLSMPLESVTTPTKLCLKSDDSESDNELEKTLIPQLDGEIGDVDARQSTRLSTDKKKAKFKNLKHVDEYDESKKGKKIYIRKRFYVNIVQRCSRDMPLLDDQEHLSNNINHSDCKNIFGNYKKMVKFKEPLVEVIKNSKDSNNSCKIVNDSKKSKVATLKQKKTKILRKKVATLKRKKSKIVRKKTKLQNKVAKLMQDIHHHDKKMMILLSKNNKPIFKIVAGRRLGTPSQNKHIDHKELTTVKILGDIIKKSATYVMPSLRVIIKYPNDDMFIFQYSSKSIYPKVVAVSNIKNFEFVKHKERKKYLQVIKQKAEDKKGNRVESLTDKATIYIFSDRYLRNLNNPDILKKIKSNLELPEIADIIQKQLLEHIKMAHTSITSFNYLKDSPTNIKTNNVVSNNARSLEATPKLTNPIEDIHPTRYSPVKHIKTVTPDNNNEESFPNNNYPNMAKIDKLVEIKPTLGINKYDDNIVVESHRSRIAQTSEIKNHSKRPERYLDDLDKIDKTHHNAHGRFCNIYGTSKGLAQHSKNNSQYSHWEKVIALEKYKGRYLGADGTIDSSSSDDENPAKKNKGSKNELETIAPRRSIRLIAKRTSETPLSVYNNKEIVLSSNEVKTKMLHRKSCTAADSPRRYSALPIFVNSPKSSKLSVPPANTVRILVKTNEETKEEKNSINMAQPPSNYCDINVKRKLDFNLSSLQSTVIEEHLVCTFSPSSRSKTVNLCEPVINSNKTSVDSELRGEYNPRNSAEDSIFSSDSESGETNASKYVSVAANMLTTAEKYDKENNYQAKEGSSKIFTLQPIGNTKSSQEVKELQSSSEGSSLGMLTPYQPQELGYKYNLSTIKDEGSDFLIGKKIEIGDISPPCESPKLVPYQHINTIQEQQNINTIKIEDTTNNTSKLVIIEPSRRAPTKQEVLRSLDNLQIPHAKPAEPFYSNSEDVTGCVEVGFNVLKINSQTTVHLSEFHSHNDALNTFRRIELEHNSIGIHTKKSNINHLLLSHCEPGNIIITPLIKPPTLSMIREWLKNKIDKTNSEVSTQVKCHTETPKLRIPQSPGGDEDMDMSLTLSPTTPRASQILGQNSSESSDKPSSPILRRTSKRRKQEIFNKHLLKSTPKLQPSGNSNINSCQITGVTINNTFGFDNSIENLQDARTVLEHQNLTLMVMELHTRTRVDMKPDPFYDSVRAVFYTVANDVAQDNSKPTKCKGIIAINSLPLSPGTSKYPILNGIGVDCDVIYTDSEENLIEEFLKVVNYWNPDIISGYEIEMLSWGYLIERSYILGLNIKPRLDRSKVKCFKDDESSQDLKIVGRIVLDVWRLMRHEIALQSYTFESIVYHILHRRVPHYSFKDLTFWWDHRSNIFRHRTAVYYLTRVETMLELFDKLDLVGRTSELARLFGIQFYEVLSRGTQFRVESMMLRLAKPLNFIPVSPSVQQRAHMKAPEYIPLILEPESKLYNDPVIVLDFQSLYPSIIIAYNYCFTTCLGKVDNLGKNGPFQFGATQLRLSKKLLDKLLKRDLVNFSPCGVGFVKKKVRDGILPRMLREILDTRLMVKNSMKENKGNQVLQKVLHNRQLGLKLIANVTYGYTSANFSGRMPSVEVGDSVVSKGRETLQRAIEMVENTSEWGAKVVYGDTDSLFVMVPGRTRDYAFEIGKKIADAVTASNPDPIKLKLEKVYQPCILQTKKRYVGYMYESADQKDPVYEAKGIETVRRDGCPAVSKMLEKCIRILFETKDVSLVKKYVLRQFNKIQAGRASIQDLTFAKEYRGAAGYRPRACVPALELTKKSTILDKRNEPRSGERVPYVIVNGPPGLPLIRLVKSPQDLLDDPSLRPNALYYITRVIIPPINRCFNLIGADLHTWYNQMPRKQTRYLPSSVSPEKKSTISQYFATASCVSCGEQTQLGICQKCCDQPQLTTVTLMEKMRIWERNYQNCVLICQTCTLTQTEIKCSSLDCPVLYRRIQTNRDLQQATYIRQLLTSSEF